MNTIVTSSKRINYITSLILSAAMFCTNVMADSSIQQDPVLASFERDLNREPGAVTATHSLTEDPLHTQINIALWNQGANQSGENQVLASFKRDLNRVPGPVTRTATPAAMDDPLHVHVNMVLWQHESYEFSNNQLLAQVNQ